MSGNLKPWPVNGSPPKRPLSYRQPVPQGLIESIGQSVQQLDTVGVKYENHQSGVYLPPPAGDTPLVIGELNSLPLANAPKPFLSQEYGAPLSLSLVQEPRVVNSGDSNCGHGPVGIQDSYGPPPSGAVQHSTGTNIVTSYEPPPSGNYNEGDTSNQQTLSGEYGIPSGSSSNYSPNFDTNVRSSQTVNYQTSSSEKHQQFEQSQSSHEHADAAASLTGLNVVSAQQSHSFSIPVQGNLGSYHLQFQSANGLGDGSNGLDAPPHEQLLSEGLLQSIISAIEQPGRNGGQIVQQASYDQQLDHKDVDIFLKSPQGQEALAEPKKSY